MWGKMKGVLMWAELMKSWVDGIINRKTEYYKFILLITHKKDTFFVGEYNELFCFGLES